MLLSSPPRRGCFRVAHLFPHVAVVFPASAGVFLSGHGYKVPPRCLPRLGGGVSAVKTRTTAPAMSSPPRRGCFQRTERPKKKRTVFPASAGVFPTLTAGRESSFQSSPPRRGCFQKSRFCELQGGVFPASAGVFLAVSSRKTYPLSLPRLGGGVSRIKAHVFTLRAVFPASAGVFLSASV